MSDDTKTASQEKPAYGLVAEIPDGVAAAWGARAILSYGKVDVLPDRQQPVGEEDARRRLGTLVNSNFGQVRDEVLRLCNRGLMIGNREQKHVLFENDEVIVVGNTNASYGYLYLAAWLK